MADDQHRPFELVDRSLEGLAGPDVEVVGRLVHDQEVGGRGAEPGQGGLGLLAAGELADGLEHDLAGEAEARQQVADVPLDPLGIVLGPDGSGRRSCRVRATGGPDRGSPPGPCGRA